MRIILEGCDGTGKTTLANLLASKYNLDICHCTTVDPNDFQFYKQAVRKNNVVWDCYAIGELIYPEIFSRKTDISPEDVRIILWNIKELGGKCFVLTERPSVIKKRLLAKGIKDFKILGNIEKINNEFIFYANQYNIPVINTSYMTLSEIFEMIEKDLLINNE